MVRYEESMVDQRQRMCQQILGDLAFVQWDRFFETGPRQATFFGWIDREQGADFVTVEIDFLRGKVVSYATSSPEHAEEIADILDVEQPDYKRVENYVQGLDNVVTVDEPTDGSSQGSVALTLQDLLEARDRLSADEATVFDQIVQTAAHQEQFYELDDEERRRRKQIVDAAFPDRPVDLYQIRQWAVVHDPEAYSRRADTGE